MYQTESNVKKYVLHLLKNLYELKQASKKYFEYLCDHLRAEHIGIELRNIDPCIYYKEEIILVIYVDNCLIFSKKKDAIDALIEQLRMTFVLTDEGSVSTYIGIQVEMDKKENKMKLKQPFLVERIIDALNCNSHITVKETPATPKPVLHKDTEAREWKQEWHYRLAIGMLNF